MPNKSVCIMTSVHRHDDVRIYHKGAKTLKQSGFDVTILCTDFEGTDENGINFIKLDIPKGRMKRILNASRIFYQRAVELNCDYYHFHDPELMQAGLKLTKTNHKKVIYDIHEDVPRQILTKPYLNPFIAKICSWFVERYETASVKKYFAVICAEPVIFDRIKSLNKNTVLVCNYPKLEEFEPVPYSDRKNKICYIGGITKIRGIYEMVKAVENSEIKLILAGQFEDEMLFEDIKQQNGYKNVDYRGFVGREGVKDILSTVKAGLVTLNPIPKYLTALPVKMFEYMVAEVPVIASDFAYWKEIVDDAKCGICVDPLNPNEIRSAIQYIIQNPDIAKEMGINGRKAVLLKYNWGIEKQKLINLYCSEDFTGGNDR